MRSFVNVGTGSYIGVGHLQTGHGLIRKYNSTSPFEEQELWTGTTGTDELYCITRIDANTLYAFGRNKRLVSNDNEANWTDGTSTITGQSNGAIKNVHFASANNGVGIGMANNSNHYIYNTTDGGVTWTANTSIAQNGSGTEYQMHFLGCAQWHCLLPGRNVPY